MDQLNHEDRIDFIVRLVRAWNRGGIKDREEVLRTLGYTVDRWITQPLFAEASCGQHLHVWVGRLEADFPDAHGAQHQLLCMVYSESRAELEELAEAFSNKD